MTKFGNKEGSREEQGRCSCGSVVRKSGKAWLPVVAMVVVVSSAAGQSVETTEGSGSASFPPQGGDLLLVLEDGGSGDWSASSSADWFQIANLGSNGSLNGSSSVNGSSSLNGTSSLNGSLPISLNGTGNTNLHLAVEPQPVGGLERGDDLLVAFGSGNATASQFAFQVTQTAPSSLDTDSDGLTDYAESYLYGTDPENADTDGDGLSDFEEVSTYGTDPLAEDLTLSPSTLSFSAEGGEKLLSLQTGDSADWTVSLDADWFSVANLGANGSLNGSVNGTGSTNGTSSFNGSSSLNGTGSTHLQVTATRQSVNGTQRQGSVNATLVEVAGGSWTVTVAQSAPSLLDTDGDGLSNFSETYEYGTDPLLADTDGDGIGDGVEVTYRGLGFNPLENSDSLLQQIQQAAASLPGMVTPAQKAKLARGGGIELSPGPNNSVDVTFILERSEDLTTWTEVDRLDQTVSMNGKDRIFLRVRKPGAP